MNQEEIEHKTLNAEEAEGIEWFLGTLCHRVQKRGKATDGYSHTTCFHGV